jgi:hypothetical protein
VRTRPKAGCSSSSRLPLMVLRPSEDSCPGRALLSFI